MIVLKTSEVEKVSEVRMGLKVLAQKINAFNDGINYFGKRKR
jgi:hypothetical protein